jgi:hypothetical protein
MSAPHETHGVVFLFDVDNALLDNHRVIVDLERHLMRAFGTGLANQYFETLSRASASWSNCDLPALLAAAQARRNP